MLVVCTEQEKDRLIDALGCPSGDKKYGGFVGCDRDGRCEECKLNEYNLNIEFELIVE